MTNMRYFHTVTVGCVDLITSTILVACRELVQLAGEVVCGPRVRVPVGVDVVGGSMRILAVTVATVIIRIILIAPPALAGRVGMNFADLARDVHVRSRSTATAIAAASTTIATASIITATARITAATSIIAVVVTTILTPVITPIIAALAIWGMATVTAITTVTAPITARVVVVFVAAAIWGAVTAPITTLVVVVVVAALWAVVAALWPTR